MGKNKTKATAVGILGMHRSGTSLLTRVVNLLGAYIGEQGELMQPGPDNPAGFWEHQPVYDLQERLLATLHRTWDTAVALPAGWETSTDVAPLRAELIELIETRFAGHELWAWKDPRTCILLPLWKDVLAELDIELRCLMVTRNPLDVARSLEARNGFELNEGFGLWFNHNLAMLEHSTGLPRSLVSYHRFLSDWKASVANWAPVLNLRWSADDETLGNAIAGVVRTDLCHSSSSLEDLTEAGCPKPVIELARTFDEMEKSGDTESGKYAVTIRRLIDTHTTLSTLHAHDAARARAVQHELRLQLAQQRSPGGDGAAEPRAEQVHSDGLVELQEQQLKELQAQLAEKESALAEASKQRHVIEKQLALREREATGAQRRVTDYVKEIAETRVQKETSDRRLQLREREATDAEKRISEFVRQLAESRVQKETIERQLAQRERELADVEARESDHVRAMADVRVHRQTIEKQLELRERKLGDMQARQAEFEEKFAEARAHLKERERELAQAHGQLAELRQSRDAEKLEAVEEELATAHALVSERDAKLLELQSEADKIWTQLLSEREAVERQAEAHEAGIAQMQAKADEIWLQLESEREQAQANVDRIHRSYSWRITRPMRAVFDALQAGNQKLGAIARKIRSRKRAPLKIASPSVAAAALPAVSVPAGAVHERSAVPDLAGAPKVIAFLLPQFHPIPQNDEWWGKGFTEWTNVTRAHALYNGHHQPRRPADLGYYDLRLPEVRATQAELARAHGIHGFCYHYYWFDRERLLERPLDDVLLSGEPDFPFCICWANESWSRRWDGSEDDILIGQDYREGFAERFAEDAVPYLKDPRYIRVEDRPFLVVYRIDQIPDIEQTIATWRQVFRDRGVGEVFLGAVECFDMVNPTRFGFDAAIEFPPHNPPPAESRVFKHVQRKGVPNLDPNFAGTLRDYRECAQSRSAMEPTGYPLFRGVMPSWDNTARKGLNAMIYHDASPEAYQGWLTSVLQSATAFSAPHEPVVFINAWNEWAEGAYLEPDDRHGHDYLLATRAAVQSVSSLHPGDETAGVRGGESADAPAPRPVTEGRVQVSVIIPAFNQAHLTRACLDSLRNHEADFPFEVLVVDDASTDDTPAIAGDIPWVRFFRQQQNQGFGAACNFGASQARGEYLVFLNNDTTVCEGWLNALRQTFEDWPGAGLVGSKLVLMDGTMQECGSLLFEDGSAANYGRGGDPRDPHYCYAREADYVSGAAIMIRKELFDDLDGFDDLYEPAYYEDTDMALKIRAKGLQVVVNPHAEVRHLEGGTAGTDTSKGIKRYQVINQGKFLARWKDTLATFPVRPPGEPGLRYNRPRVLVVDWIIPRPDRDSGSLRMAGILGALRKLDCHVTVAARDMSCEAGYELPLERIGVEVLRGPHYESLDRYLAGEGGSFDYVIFSRRDTATMHIDSIERYCGNAQLVFDTCDLHFIRESRAAALGQSSIGKRKLEKMKKIELDLIARSDTTIVVSPEEREVLKGLLPEQDVRIVSNIVDPSPTARPFSERSGLLFIGWFLHTPNVDGVLWFVREVLPELALRGLEPVFHIVGSDPPEELLALQSEQVRIHGFVPDVEPLFDECRLSVAPLRYGAGVKGKINQSMALGVPFVTTSIGAEGTFVEDGDEVMVADDAAGFAARVQAAYESEALWSKLRQQGLRCIENYFSSAVATDVLRDLVLPSATSGQAPTADLASKTGTGR